MSVFLSKLLKAESAVEDERDKFEQTGPSHLLFPLWSDPAVKRAAIGCLAQSVYVMEKDRQLGYQGTEKEMAPKWRNHFNYKLVQIVYNDESNEQVIDGAVFRWSQRKAAERPANAPEFVVAFRGTMLCGHALHSDLHANLSLLLQNLYAGNRLARALGVVKYTLTQADARNICIAGHSLGAALCLIIGATLFKDGVDIDTHAFNPPFPSLRFDVPHSSTWRATLHSFRVVAVSVATSIVQDEKARAEASDAFLALKAWRPHIYVNSHDPVCLSYIGYFMNRGYGKGKFTCSALHNSFQSLALSFFGDFKPYHLIPSARLYVIKDETSKKFKQAHGMHQWWSTKFQVIFHEVIFDTEGFENHSGAHDAT